MMSLHKLSAGDGYTYLTRQVAAADGTDRGRTSLADYYSAKGEAPGRWMGRGLDSLATGFTTTGTVIQMGSVVAEAHMRALFGEGRHPEADRIEAAAVAAGASAKTAMKASALGRRFITPTSSPVPQFRVEVARRFQQWNLDQGLPSAGPVPVGVRASIRTDVGLELFTQHHDRAPMDDRELSGFIAKASRPGRQPVAGFDLTFSPVKSVSTLWAVAPREVSEAIEAAHTAAVASTIAWIEDEVVYSREGAGSVRQVDVTGVLAAVFTHRDSRAGEPDLHTHVAISNKVQTLSGKWLSLDGSVLYQATVAASERYNTRLETELRTRLGVRFADRDGTAPGKRAVREVVGVDPALMARWSSRRAMIDIRRGELAAQFQTDHGRPPTAKEAIDLAQQANLETREAKHEPRSLAEQRSSWADQAGQVLGGPARVAAMLDQALAPSTSPTITITAEQVAARAIRTVVGSRARFQSTHVLAEIERVARAVDVDPEVVDQLVTDASEAAITHSQVVSLTRRDEIAEPGSMRRQDGTSVYQQAHSTLYSTTQVVDAETYLLEAARATGGRSVSAETVAVAILESAANRVELNPAQAQLVTELATSGSRLQLALAPAGSGKTTAMRVLASAWCDGGGTVLGLAPSAVAAGELREAIGGDCDTLAKLVFTLNNPDVGTEPHWMSEIGADTLVVIDEAGMAGTVELATAVRFLHSRGASVRLIGDDQQLAAVAAGGVLRDIAHEVGVVTLSELMRFTDPAEAATTLAVREGHTSALGFYLDRGRVHEHDQATVADGVYQAWSADTAAGRTSLMVALSNQAVTELNARARADRLARDGLRGPEVPLRASVAASAGDVIVTRHNDRTLRFSPTDWVKNGDRWDVLAIHADGAVQARHHGSGRHQILPAGYVAEHVDLGYASTVHGAQGTTVDTCHTALTGAESRQLFYVAATRGRHANHFYVSTGGDGDAHAILRPDRVTPPTASEILEGILARDGSQTSARTEVRQQADPAVRLGVAAARYTDAVSAAAADVVGADGLTRIEQAAERVLPGLTDAAAWVALRDRLAVLSLEGKDPTSLLAEAVGTGQSLASSMDPAAVLHWRMPLPHAPGPLGWLPGAPRQVLDHPEYGPWVTARAAQVRDLVDQVGSGARAMATTGDEASAPAWARTVLEAPGLVADLAVWRATHAVEESDASPTGPAQRTSTDQPHQKSLNLRVAEQIGQGDLSQTAWRPLLKQVAPDALTDTWWPVLAARLTLADAAGVDVPTLLHEAVATGPLPDDHAAAALWSRLAPTLAPAVAATADTGSGAARLRPPWTPALVSALPDDLARRRVLNSPAWPALVAVVHVATSNGADPEAIVADAVALIHPDTIGVPGGVAYDQLTTVLAWRVADLLHHPLSAADAAALEDTQLDEADFTDEEMTAFLVGLAADHQDALPAPPDATFVSDPEPHPDHHPAPSEADRAAAAAPATSRDRVLQLNTAAADYYAGAYPGSDAARYLNSRLGTDLTGDSGFTVGYAPTGPDALTTHLTRTGDATPAELVDAGLAKYDRHGGLVDVFRDRLMFGIHDQGGDLVGFVGRAAPDATYGPKYLNTPDTIAFTKGSVLFGLAETHQERAQGAPVTRVEGPIDAIAVTLASQGKIAGVAPLGTALTDTQADLLASSPVLFHATDDDAAGVRAATTDYWKLVARGCVPTVVALHGAGDPAELYTKDHGQTLALTLATADASPTLAATLIDWYATTAAADGSVQAKIWALRQSAAAIAALPPHHWEQHIMDTTARLDVAGGDEITYYEVLAHAIDWHPADDGRGTSHTATDNRPPLSTEPTPAERLAAIAARLKENGRTRVGGPELSQERTDALRRLAEELKQRRTQQPPRRRPTPAPAEHRPGHDHGGPSIG